MLEPQIFSRVEKRLSSGVRKVMKVFKRTCGKNPNWLVVEAFGGDDKTERDTKLIDTADA